MLALYLKDSQHRAQQTLDVTCVRRIKFTFVMIWCVYSNTSSHMSIIFEVNDTKVGGAGENLGVVSHDMLQAGVRFVPRDRLTIKGAIERANIPYIPDQKLAIEYWQHAIQFRCVCGEPSYSESLFVHSLHCTLPWLVIHS
jgi:hypothetical protein